MKYTVEIVIYYKFEKLKIKRMKSNVRYDFMRFYI